MCVSYNCLDGPLRLARRFTVSKTAVLLLDEGPDLADSLGLAPRFSTFREWSPTVRRGINIFGKATTSCTQLSSFGDWYLTPRIAL